MFEISIYSRKWNFLLLTSMGSTSYFWATLVSLGLQFNQRRVAEFMVSDAAGSHPSPSTFSSSNSV
jgi:hypothetical protein